jgi:CheY-like chemotaxis protein
MPEMNWYEAANFIRTQLKLNLPIIASSANASNKERERGISIGMNDYLSKPFKAELLFTLINKYIDYKNV